MALLIIFTALGMFIGQFAFYENGWLVGGAVGFLITKVFQLGSHLKRLEKELSLLQQQPTTAPKSNEDSIVAAAPVIEPEPQNQVNELPLEERLKAHGIKLPPEFSSRDANQAAWASAEEEIPNQNSQAFTREESPKQHSPRATPLEKAFGLLRRFFTEGNPIVRIGMVVMFFGMSFLITYASNQGLLPLEVRMAAVAFIALALIILGWKTRARVGGYGLVLQGGGIAALYLTVFAAAKMYSMMPPSAALGLMILVVILGAALAVLQNAQVLALMATAGGFLAPILTSENSGNHVGLFSYYLLLNIGILVIAWFKTWRLLNWVGFVFTFAISSAWGVLQYEPHFFTSTQPFLIAFFLLYLTVSILFSLKQPPDLKGLVDGSLVFGLPILAFGLQAALLKHTEYGLAISAIVLATIYIFIARLLWEKYRHTHQVLIESFIALGVCFATLSIPLALDAQWTSAAWVLEAVGLIWVGLRQHNLLPRIAGYGLHIAAAASLTLHGIHAGPSPIVSGDFISIVLLSISAFTIAYLLFINSEKIHQREKNLQICAHTVGWMWWLAAGYIEIHTHISGENHFAALSVFLALSVAVFLLLSKKIHWPLLAKVAYWMLPLTVIWAMQLFGEALFYGYDAYPSEGWNLFALGIFLVVQYRFLWKEGRRATSGLQSVYHILTAWFIFTLIYWEASHWQHKFSWGETAEALLWFGCLVAPTLTLIYFSNKKVWPFSHHAADYKNLIPAPLLFLLLFWFLYTTRYSGTTTQIYLPLLNPLDLAQGAVLIIFAYAIKQGMIGLTATPVFFRYGSLGLLAFIWVNVMLLRAVHHYAEVNYTATILWDSIMVQMSLSILWSICALIVMNVSRRLQIRELWLVGAVLLGAVLLKLFTKDLTGTGTLARIVSFMVVGGLMLLIGYLSPIPAKAQVNTEEKI